MPGLVKALLLLLLTATAARADLGASVTATPAGAIDPLENKNVIITLSNSDTANALTSVGFSNSLPGTLPDGLFISGAATYTCFDPAASSSSAGAGTLTATQDTQPISLSGGTIPAAFGGTNGTCTITIPVTAGTSTGNVASYDYTITGGSVSGFDGTATQTNSGSVTQSVVVNSINNPSITTHVVSGGNLLVLGGGAETLTITVQNTNDIDIPNFTLTDVFPLISGNPAFEVAATPNATGTCNNGGAAPSFTPSNGDTTLSMTGTLPARSGGTNGICTFTVDVSALRTGGVYQTVVADTIPTGNFTNDIGIPLQSPSNRNVTIRSPLSVDVAYDANELATGQSDDLRYTFTNSATTPISVASFTNDPIDGVGNNSYGLKINGTPAVSCPGGANGSVSVISGTEGFTWTGGTIAAGATCEIVVNFTGTVQTPGVPITFTTTVSEGDVSAGAIGGETIINEAANDSILIGDNIRVSITSTPGTVAPGNPVRYDILVENFGAAAVPNVNVADTLPAGLTFLTGTIGGINFTPTLSAGCGALTDTNTTGETAPDFTIGSLPARSNVNTTGKCTVTYYAMTPTTPGWTSAGNNLGVGDVTFSGGQNEVASNTTTISESPTMAMVKSFSPSSTFEGVDSTVTISVSNWSAQDLTNVSVTDNLPVGSLGQQLQVAATPNASTSCGAGTITATPGANTFSMSGGTVPARGAGGSSASAGACTITVNVVGAAGSYNNSASGTADSTPADGSAVTSVSATSNTSTLTYASALSAAKSFNPTSVTSGGTSTAIIRFSNASPGTLSGLGVNDPLPSGMVLAPTPNAYTTCGGTPSITATAGASSIVMTGADLLGSSNCDLVFDVVATGSSAWTNTIPTGNITANGGIINVNPVSATLGILPGQNILVSEATSPATLNNPGDVSRLTLTITNGSNPVSNLSLTDFFTTDGLSGSASNGIVITGTPAPATTCTGGIVTAVAGGNSFSLSNASMTGGEVCEFSVNVTSLQTGGTTNFVPIGSITTAEGYSNTNQASTSITTLSNIGVTKQFTPPTITAGDRSRLTLTLFNPTNSPITDLSLTDSFPAGLTVPPGANPATTCSGGSVNTTGSNQITMTGGVLGPASGTSPASCTISVDVTAAAEGDYVNLVNAGDVTGTSNGNPVSNTNGATDTLRARSPLEVQIAIDGETLDTAIQTGSGFTTGSAFTTRGTAETMTIRLRNNNSTPLTSVQFTDALPSGLVLSTTPNATSTCSSGTNGTVTAPVSGTSVIFTGGVLAGSGGTCTITVDVLSNTPGDYINDIPIGAVSTAENVTNSEQTSAELVVADPPTVGLQFDAPVVAPNGTSVVTITLGNPNSSPITLTSGFDFDLPTVPGNLLVGSTPGIGGSCPGTVTATAGSGTISYANGATIPAGGCTITVNVTGATPGTHTGLIQASDLQTSVGSNPSPASADLIISTQGYVSGRVFGDNNTTPNGTYDAGSDTPLSGQSIELHSGSGCSGTALQTVTTNANGSYLFHPLAAGTYSVCQPAQPSGTDNGTTTAGTIVTVGGSTGTPGTASNPTATTSQIIGIVLGSSGGDTSGSPGNNFAEVTQSSIAGTVFRDVNANGLQNGADTGLSGETIELLDGGSVVVATTTTDANGNYVFSGLSPGTYTVRQPNQPANTSDGTVTAGAVPNGGTSGTPTASGTVPSLISGLVLPPNAASTGNNFAEEPNTRTVSGQVFVDYDGNGALNGPDYGLGGETINLTGSDINGNPVNFSTTTAADGTYAFLTLPEGTYTIDQPNQPGSTTNGTATAGSTGGTGSNPTATSSQIAGINLTGTNTISAGNNFAEIPGAAPDVSVALTHNPSQFTENNTVGTFTATPSNVGSVDTSGPVTVMTTLPAGITPTGGSGTGWSCTVSGQVVTCTSNDVIPAGMSGNPITIATATGSGIAGSVLTATTQISGGGEPAIFNGNNSASDPVPIAVSASLGGTVWLDIDHDRILDPGEPRQAGWTVELLNSTGAVVGSAVSDATGAYTIANIIPGSGYELRFREPTTGAIFGRPVPNETGAAFVNGTQNPTTNPAGADNSTGTLTGLTINPGDNIVQQSLPLDPAGVIYDSVSRQPISGATVTISGPPGFTAADVVGGSTTVTTGATGFYQFLLNATAPSGTYTLSVAPPAGYIPGASTIIPGCTNAATVSGAPDPALVQDDNAAPTQSAALHDPATCPASTALLSAANQATTQYFSQFVITIPGSANVVNNHIPVDPVLSGAIVMTKATPFVDVTRGSLVPYTITARNTLSATLSSIDLVDVMPPGFSYRAGTASIEGTQVEPSISGRTLTWAGQTLNAGQTLTLKMMLNVSTGIGDGVYDNQTYAFNSLASAIVSNTATASVRVGTDPVFDCSDIIGKVFTDWNGNGYQDAGETGLGGVRLATVNGLLITTDDAGRYSIPCGAIPNGFRGSNFVLKLDERTLPVGYEPTCGNPLSTRATRGKMSKLNFGAAPRRVVRIELFDDAFLPGSTEPTARLSAALDNLPGTALSDAPSRVLLQHMGRSPLAAGRLATVTRAVESAWSRNGTGCPLPVQSETKELPAGVKGVRK